MKKHLSVLLVLSLCFLVLAGCGETEPPVFTDVDFTTSSYKHINNGGVTEDDVLPYNVDAITGATMTVEGPAVVTSIPLSVRELENRNDGLFRGGYKDSKGMLVYEGLDLYYLLNEMVEGDNGIILTDTAYKAVLKNSNRATVAEFTLSDITKAHEDGRPILLAYGVGTTDESAVAPFVFDGEAAGTHSLGYVDKLKNDDGCIKLVYDLGKYGANKSYKTFSNIAYVYVCEENEPGFKHTEATDETFSESRYTDYIVTFRGEQLGYELDLTTKELEALVQYNKDGSIVKGGIGYSDTYSLANNAYWYVNEYEGLDLYKLLMYLGMDSAEEMGTKGARTTLIRFVAADGVASNESFSVDTLSYPDVFGFYNKNAADLNDGTYVPTNADLVKTGYPVLLAYGVNRYPYTVNKTDPAYVSGLQNSGGPFRVVFGKTQYNHANGSNQVQFLSEVLVGNDVYYNTHAFTTNEAQKALADSKLTLTVKGDVGTLLSKELTVADIESVVYGEDVAGNVKKAAKVKNTYEIQTADGTETAIYEGINLEYLLMDVIGIPGTNGTITFTNGTDKLTVTLEELFRSGYNATLGRENLRSVIAFAKNGSPLVENDKSAGYVADIKLNPMLDSDPATYTVENAGGPLAVIIPSTTKDSCDAKSIEGVTGIEIDLIPDSYAHIASPYDKLAGSKIRFYGEGLDAEKTYTVSDFESRQTKTKTLDYSVLNNGGTLSEQRYRGLAIYDIFTEIGIKNNAGDVTVYAADGSKQTFSLSLLKKSYENFVNPDKGDVYAILAFGTGDINGSLMEGVPLVKSDKDAGYDAALKNDGGALKLIVPQESADFVNASLCVKNVVAVEVSANDIDTWSHSMSDVFEEFLDEKFTVTFKNDANEWTHDFTVRELESLKGIIVREKYSVLDVGTCEGIDIWKFMKLIAGNVEGFENPVSITVYANDGYKNDLLSVFYKEGFVEGVIDENGNRRPLILCYALNGYPLVSDESHPGYTGIAGNTAGPIRVIAEGNQGASVKLCVKLVVTLPGSGNLDINLDPAVFNQN